MSFEVKRGEVLGIIGRNGAGKTTLLKILSRITEPTEGRVTLRGRVASLLEVGTGFHPELTGRENIFLNGAILGMTRREIRKKFDEIVAFAEVENFLDTPVKRYSCGMYVRLAFAVAAHLEPEILIVDEVLAVGDAEFQKKCLGKMDEVSRREAAQCCSSAITWEPFPACARRHSIWLDKGSVRSWGEARKVIGEYLFQSAPNLNRIIDLGRMPRRVDTDDRLRLKSLEWLCDLPLRHGEPLKARIDFTTRTPLESVSVGVGFSNVDGRRLLTYETDFQQKFRPTLSQPGAYSCEIEVVLPLAPDVYDMDIGCRSSDVHSLDYIPASTRLEIIAGLVNPRIYRTKGCGSASRQQVDVAKRWVRVGVPRFWRHRTYRRGEAAQTIPSATE